MKLLFVNSMKGMGGGERWLLDCAGGLRGRGHTCLVAGRTGSPLLERAAAAGLGVIPAPFTHDLDPRTILRLRKAYRAERPDLVIAQIQRAHRLAVVASALGARAPVLLRVGQLRPVKRKWINRWAWGQLSAVIANCDAVLADLSESRLVPRGRMHRLYNGLPERELPGRAQARGRLGLPAGAETVSCVARLVKHKGHDTLLDAWARIHIVRPGARLLLAGGGPERTRLEALAAKLGMRDSVRFLGELEDPAEVCAASDISVLASREEGLPYALLEAVQAGVPCVATRVAGVEEILAHESSGLTVAPGDAAALAWEIIRLLRDAGLRRDLAAEAGRILRRQFGYQDMLEQAEWIFAEAAHRA